MNDDDLQRFLASVPGGHVAYSAFLRQQSSVGTNVSSNVNSWYVKHFG